MNDGHLGLAGTRGDLTKLIQNTIATISKKKTKTTTHTHPTNANATLSLSLLNKLILATPEGARGGDATRDRVANE